MKMEFIREQSGNYMAIQGEKQTDCYEMKMVECNHINGLLDLTIRRVNNQSLHLYHISGLICMKEAYERSPIGAKEIQVFFQSMKEVLTSLREYLLRPDGLMLNVDQIFMDRNTGRAYFAYYENENGDFFANLKQLFEDCILQQVDHNDNEAVTLVYGTYKRLCSNNCTIGGLFEVEEREEYEYSVHETRQENPHVMPERESEEREVPDKKKIYRLYVAFGAIGAILLWALFSLLIPGIRMKGMGAYFYGILAIGAAIGAYLLFRWYKENKDTLVCIESQQVEIPYEEERIVVRVPQKEHGSIIKENSTKADGSAVREHGSAVREHGSAVREHGSAVREHGSAVREHGGIAKEWEKETLAYGNESDCANEEPESAMTMILNADTMPSYPVLRWREKEQYREYVIKTDLIIGSEAKKADCVIKLPGVSRIHAKIVSMDGRYFIKDLNSTNGTRVGDVILASFQLFPLVKSEVILLGNQSVEFDLPNIRW